MCLDCVISFVFLLSTVILRIVQKLDQRQIEKSVLTVEDFAVKLKQLPVEINSLQEYKATLSLELEKMLLGQP